MESFNSNKIVDPNELGGSMDDADDTFEEQDDDGETNPQGIVSKLDDIEMTSGDNIDEEEDDDTPKNDDTMKDDLMDRTDADDEDYEDDSLRDSTDTSYDSEMLINRSPSIPQQKVLDTIAVSGSVRNGGNMMTDPLGTGELLDDETSAAALLALLGFLMVILVVSFLICTARRTMGAVPITKKGSGKQDDYKISSSPLTKRRN
jgi:hypothetical protein